MKQVVVSAHAYHFTYHHVSSRQRVISSFFFFCRKFRVFKTGHTNKFYSLFVSRAPQNCNTVICIETLCFWNLHVQLKIMC